MAAASSRFAALRSAFSNPNYAIYISANSVSLIGFWMQRVAVGWLTWEITRSEFWVGAVAFAELGPLIVVGPLTGVWADRIDRKKMAVLAQSLMMLQALVLFFLAVFGLLNIALLFSLALVEGIVHAAYQPIRLSIIPNLVPRRDLVAAAAFTAVVFNVARFVGPALAGVVMAIAGPAWPILFNGISYGLIVIAWLFIHLPPKEEMNGRFPSFMSDIKAGFHYVTEKQALLLMFMLLTIIAFFIRPVTLMLSAFVGAIYQEGPETLALFTSALGVGAVLAGLKVSMSGMTQGLIRAILVNTLITVVTLAAFASVTNKWVGTGLIFLLGYAITITSVASQTLVQNSVDDEMRGRVLSLWVAFTRGAPALGVLIIGWLASHFGLMWPNIAAAVLCFGGLLLMLDKRKVMRVFFEQS